jgi:hypothetical protein
MAQSQVLQPGLGAGGMPLTQKRESLWQDAIRRLMNRAAVLGGPSSALKRLLRQMPRIATGAEEERSSIPHEASLR